MADVQKVTTQQRLNKVSDYLKHRIPFVLLMWVLSRSLILLMMLVVVPAFPPPRDSSVVPVASWEVFTRWDSGSYLNIATTGYEFKNDGQGYNIAFFPLFPLLIKLGIVLGLSPIVSGVLVSNLAFLGLLLVVYRWIETQYGKVTARWAIATLAWCPFSLFGTVIYTEGLFLLVTTLALKSFESHQYRWAALWGGLATATRLPGISLMPAFLITAWRERRPPLAYLAALATSAGICLFSLYCYLAFQDPLAFIHVQKAWNRPQDFYGQYWLKMLVQIVAGSANWNAGKIVNPWHPLLFIVICLSAYFLWQFRAKLGVVKTSNAFLVLAILLWLIAGMPLFNTTIIVGSAYLLWSLRSKLSCLVFSYGFCSLALILSTGRTTIERYVYGIISVAIAFGILATRYPRWGYATLIFFAYLLASYSMRYAQQLWVG